VNLVAGTYAVTVTDAHFCRQFGTYTVTNIGAPSVSIVASSDVTCFGVQDGTAAVAVSGGTGPFSFAWSTPIPQTNDTLVGVGPGVWGVTVTDALGCLAIDSVTILEPSVLTLTPDSIAVTCFGFADGGASVLASGGTPGYTFIWSNGDTTAAATGLSAGAYSVTVTDAKGCAQSATITLAEPLLVNAAFNANPNMPMQLQIPNASVTFLNMSQNATSYVWEFGDRSTSTDTDPSHTYTSVGDYCVTLIARDSLLCADTVVQCSYSVFQQELEIPNTFTPNGDGRNDVFQILGLEQFPNNHLAIYNRWGNLVYEKDKYDNTWTGNNYKSGDPLPDGAYFYFFTPGQIGQEDVAGDVVIFR
jgi:gliding motility-associated-like protein